MFLQNSRTYLTSTQEADRYYLTWQHEIDSDDKYSIASRHNKLWLPAAAAVGETSQATGDQQRFLTAVPPAEGTAPTITLGEIKTRIGTITAKLDAGAAPRSTWNAFGKRTILKGKIAILKRYILTG